MAERDASSTDKRMRFETEAMPHLDAIYAIAMKLTRNADDAGDLVQETVLRAYRSFDQFQSGTNCRAWLATILLNNFRNGYRRTIREQPSATTEEFDHRADIQGLAEDPPVTNPEVLVGGSSMDREVASALDALPGDFRDAMLLVDVEELSYHEVSAALNIPVGTVKSRVSRGRAMMREALGKYARERGIKRS